GISGPGGGVARKPVLQRAQRAAAMKQVTAWRGTKSPRTALPPVVGEAVRALRSAKKALARNCNRHGLRRYSPAAKAGPQSRIGNGAADRRPAYRFGRAFGGRIFVCLPVQMRGSGSYIPRALPKMQTCTSLKQASRARYSWLHPSSSRAG